MVTKSGKSLKSNSWDQQQFQAKCWEDLYQPHLSKKEFFKESVTVSEKTKCNA